MTASVGHDRVLPMLLLEGGQHREHVLAVDAAIRPEVEDHDLPSKLREAQGPRRPDPPEALGKLGSVDARRHVSG